MKHTVTIEVLKDENQVATLSEGQVGGQALSQGGQVVQTLVKGGRDVL